MAGVQGFEPQLTDPESAVLPLNDTPLFVFFSRLSARGNIIPHVQSFVKQSEDLL
jgi:hypothetical protein